MRRQMERWWTTGNGKRKKVTESLQFKRFISQTDSGTKTHKATRSDGAESQGRGRSQTLQVLSMDPETMSDPSQLNCTLLISPPCPLSTLRHLRRPGRPAVIIAGASNSRHVVTVSGCLTVPTPRPRRLACGQRIR